ncbi:hypothetical protein [Halorubrum gandharaense]
MRVRVCRPVVGHAVVSVVEHAGDDVVARSRRDPDLLASPRLVERGGRGRVRLGWGVGVGLGHFSGSDSDA